MIHSIVEAVFYHAEVQPDKLCLVDEQEKLTYAQYVERIRNMADVFQRQGIKKGDRVVVEAQQTASFLAIELALQLIGAIFVPLERNCAAEKIQAIAASCDARYVITADPPEGPCEGFSYAQLIEMTGAATQLEPVRFPKGYEISEILFSTGTTGKEKGIVLSHENDIALAENVMYGTGMEQDNVEMIPSPLNHSHGLRRYYGNMLCGATVVLVSSVMNIPSFFQSMEENHVNSMDLVPSALSILLKLSKNKLADYKNVIRYIQFGAAPLTDKDKEQIKELLPHTRLYNFYGSTESGCICIHEFGRGEDKKKCIGKPAYNAKIVVTGENGEIIRSSKETPGLLASYGKMNMLGYWRDEEETNRVLRDGYIYSNDEGYYDEDGDIILFGRKGDVINVGGNKVSPEEIENAAKKLDGIVDCGCIAIPDSVKGYTPKLFVQIEEGFPFDPQEIRNRLSVVLEPYKVPRYIERIDSIPRTYNGKLLRRELH